MSPEDWVYLFISMSVGGVVMGTMTWARMSPHEAARLKSIVRSRWGRRSWRKLDKMGLDVLVAIEADVEMAWWDEQYEKLLAEQNTSPAQWSVPTPQELMSDIVATLYHQFDGYEREARSIHMENQARELAERSRRIVSVTDGDVTYSKGGYTPRGRQVEPDCEECGYVDVRTYSGAYQHVRSEKCQRCRADEYQRAAMRVGLLSAGEARNSIANMLDIPASH